MSLSGGMDSTALLLRMISEGDDITCISYDYGQKHLIEIDRARDNISYLRENGHNVEHFVVDLRSAMQSLHSALTSEDIVVPEGHYESVQMKQTVVPNRNAIFSSVLYGFAVSLTKEQDTEVDLCLGVHGGDGNVIPPDCTAEFHEKLEDAFKIGNINTDKINYYLPYVDKKKYNIIEDAYFVCKSLNLNFRFIFENSISCYNGNGCGKCGACKDRIQAFDKAGIKDVTKYLGDVNE